jgi:ABC-type oligopeptide transport system substrate-binding subunit
VLNLRRPIFQDIRVREALQLSFDFEWLNAQNFNYFARVDSTFSNSEFAAKGLPSPGELAILEPFRDRLPPQAFGPPYENPRTDTSPTALRENLKRARDLLAEAGWKLGPDNILYNGEGKPFEIEILNNDADIAASVEPWQPNLAKLGIRSVFRQVDFALFVNRLESFDFDITQLNIGEFLMPSPSVLFSYYASSQADIQGAANYGGVKDPALDAAMAAMNRATTMSEFIDATRAFDRVMMHQRYFIPWSRRPAFNSAWWDRFGIPAQPPRFFTLLSETNNARPWPILTWWDEPHPGVEAGP